MNRPPVPHMMYRSPRPYNNRWRPPGHFPQMGFQCRPNRHFRPPVTNNTTNENNEEHWCETCDRGFPSADLLGQHKQQHQKCNIDGCQFVAHPRVITKHIQMQHSTGLYKKIANINNPEEINKWREERKKKYPTKTNIEKKAAECKEKIERGEKMALMRDRNDNHANNSTDRGPGIKRRHGFDKTNQNHRTNRPNTNQRQHNANNRDHPPARKVPKTIPKVPSVIENSKLKPFAGISSIEMHDNNNEEDVPVTKDCSNTLIEDDYFEELTPVKCLEQKTVQEPILCGALTSLVCDYGSSDEEPDEKENKVFSNVKPSELTKTIDTISVKKDTSTVTNINLKRNMKIEHNTKKEVESVNVSLNDDTQIVETKPKANDENSDDDSPEEVKTVKSIVEDTNLPTTQETVRNKQQPVSARKNIPNRNYNQRQNTRYKHKVPSTLLNKLLHKEIRQERNIVLQCIRHIKKMNYFENIIK